MKVLIHYPNFNDDQVYHFQKLAADLGDHEVIFAASDEEAISHAAEVEALMGIIHPDVLAAATKLKWAQSFSTGLDNILFPELIESDVVLSNVPGLYAPQGAEHAWALLLTLARGLNHFVRFQDKHTWKADHSIFSVTGLTLGLIGLGGFGMEMAKRAAGYDMTILALDPYRSDKPAAIAELKPVTRETLHDLLRRSDIVMLACPRTKETYHLIDAEALSMMKASAYLINVTRGGIIDEPALIAALKAGNLAGAGLDVTEEEPLPADNPLWDAPNVIITPHLAGFSQNRTRDVFEFACDNLSRYLKGEPILNIADKEEGF